MTSNAKLKAVCQEEWKQMWKEHFENLLGNSPKGTNKPTTKNSYSELDIKLEHFIQGKLNIVLIKIKNRKANGHDEITGRQVNSMNY